MIILYGIPNCETVKKARQHLGAVGVAAAEHRFHDLRRDGLPEAELQRWLAAVGWERLLNRQGSTWRRLDEAQRAAVVDAESAAAVMRAQPSVIKRPVVRWADGTVTVGFDAADFTRRAAAP